MSHMPHKDIYVRLEDPNGKQQPVINHHRVWDAERFLTSQHELHNGPRVKAEDRRVVSLATKENYNDSRKAVRA